MVTLDMDRVRELRGLWLNTMVDVESLAWFPDAVHENIVCRFTRFAETEGFDVEARHVQVRRIEELPDLCAAKFTARWRPRGAGARLLDGPGEGKVYGMPGAEPLPSIQGVCPLDYPVWALDSLGPQVVETRRVTYRLAGWDGEHWLYKVDES